MERYAIGMQDFGEIRKGNYTYVDKTGYIALLLQGSKNYFLARPRRFGKSLFLSTLEYFFSGERELFKGLAVDSHEKEWLKYPVIHIDLNGADYSEEGSLNERLNNILSGYETRFEVTSNNDFNLSERFRSLITNLYEKTGRQVVVLVDEYEKPIIDTLEFPDLMERYKNALRGFYGVLKSLDRYLKLVFLTGVTKFGQMNVFSGLNNILDISLMDEFAAICGVTQEELTVNFPEGISDIAREENIDFDGVLRLLKESYDGYHFSRKCPDIYNPYSLINAFKSKEIKPYWSYTGTPALLVKLLIQQKYNLEQLDGIYASSDRLLGVNNNFDDPVTLFYQTGYLTIKHYDSDIREFVLGFPNSEVEKAFLNFVLPFYYKSRTATSDSIIFHLNKALISGEPKKAMEYLESFSADISYEVIPAPEVERHFQSMLYIVTKLLISSSVKITPEWRTSSGRIDLLIETPKFVYVIEIKRDSTPEEALKQIKDKGYSLPFRNLPKEVFLIGVNFSTEKKRLSGFTIQKQS